MLKVQSTVPYVKQTPHDPYQLPSGLWMDFKKLLPFAMALQIFVKKKKNARWETDQEHFICLPVGERLRKVARTTIFVRALTI